MAETAPPTRYARTVKPIEEVKGNIAAIDIKVYDEDENMMEDIKRLTTDYLFIMITYTDATNYKTTVYDTNQAFAVSIGMGNPILAATVRGPNNNGIVAQPNLDPNAALKAIERNNANAAQDAKEKEAALRNSLGLPAQGEAAYNLNNPNSTSDE